LEKIPLAGIARVAGVSEPWLQNYVNEKYAAVPRVIDVTDKPKGRLTIQCDEMRCAELVEAWSFVGNKDNKQWIWLAIDRDTRECVGCFIGNRDRAGAQGLWDSLPGVYRQCAVAYTDFWASYDQIFPDTRHRSVGKETGKTNHIERLNCTLRQRISRLVRKTLSFSKNLDNHIGAIWYFIYHYNDEIKNNFAT
jgi:IS1 family transposase